MPVNTSLLPFPLLFVPAPFIRPGLIFFLLFLVQWACCYRIPPTVPSRAIEQRRDPSSKLLPRADESAEQNVGVTLTMTTKIRPRINNETVVLANCRDANGTVSSQMAYFTGAPGPVPNDVAVVSTPVGQAALWPNRITEALFPDTGVTFTADLGGEGVDGDYAGSGNNGYGSFSCWQNYSSDLYTYDDTIICSQVYNCNHEPAPANATASATAATTSTSNGSISSESVMSASSGVSTDATIAASVGGAAAGIVVLTAATICLFRWLGRRQKQPIASRDSVQEGRGCLGSWQPVTRGRSTKSERPGEFSAEKEAERQAPCFELDGQWCGVEMGVDARHELGNDRRPELDAAAGRRRPTQATGTDSTEISPLSYEPKRVFHDSASPITPYPSEIAD